jgi:hypothetical protein
VKNEDSTEAAASAAWSCGSGAPQRLQISRNRLRPNEDGEQLGEFGPLVQKFTPEEAPSSTSRVLGLD